MTDKYESVPRPCNCKTSTDISGDLSCGTGKLDFYGFWEIPCTHGLKEWLEKEPQL